MWVMNALLVHYSADNLSPSNARRGRQGSLGTNRIVAECLISQNAVNTVRLAVDDKNNFSVFRY